MGWRNFEVTLTNMLTVPAVGGIVVNGDDVTERRQLEGELRRRASYDELTGLPNRRLLGERLEVAVSRVRRKHLVLAVLFCDVDHFKRVNDTLGHEAGDSLLKEVARRLLSVARGCDAVARVGGDEFIIVLEEIEDAYGAIMAANRFAAAVREPITISDETVRVTLSIGAATTDRMRTDDVAQLLRAADAALYRAQLQGRDRAVLCERAEDGDASAPDEPADHARAG